MRKYSLHRNVIFNDDGSGMSYYQSTLPHLTAGPSREPYNTLRLAFGHFDSTSYAKENTITRDIIVVAGEVSSVRTIVF